jgi:hypothetical protein
MRKTTAFLTILATSLLSYGASAQPEGAPPAAPPPEGAPPAAPAPEGAAPAEAAPAPAAAAAPAGDDYVSRGLTLSAGTLQVTLPVVLNLSKDAVLKPVYIPLDLRFGVTNELTVFVSHSMMGMSPGFMGGGVCLGGKDRGCAKFYNNVTVGGMYSLMKNNGLELAGLLAADVRQISDDLLLAVDVGVAVKYVSAPIAVTATPTLGLGVNKRTDFNNKEWLSVPVQVAFQATPELALFLDTGIFGATKSFGDNYVVPVGIGGVFAVQHGLDVGAEFMLPKVVSGIEGNKAMDARTLTVFAAYRTN